MAVEAKACLEKIENFGGARRTFLLLEEPSNRECAEWTKGVNTAGSTRLMRVLLPVWGVIEMLQKNISFQVQNKNSVQFTSNVGGIYVWHV